jgi:hypothetical protein
MTDERDPGYGQLMLFVFTLAVLFVTGAIAILCFLTTWWMLGLVFGLHLLATGAVSYVIARGFRSRIDSAAADRAAPAPVAGKPFATGRLAGAALR